MLSFKGTDRPKFKMPMYIQSHIINSLNMAIDVFKKGDANDYVLPKEEFEIYGKELLLDVCIRLKWAIKAETLFTTTDYHWLIIYRVCERYFPVLLERQVEYVIKGIQKRQTIFDTTFKDTINTYFWDTNFLFTSVYRKGDIVDMLGVDDQNDTTLGVLNRRHPAVEEIILVPKDDYIKPKPKPIDVGGKTGPKEIPVDIPRLLELRGLGYSVRKIAKEMDRHYNKISKVLLQLKKEGKISTTTLNSNPFISKSI